MRALGYSIDVTTGINPAALATGTITGARVHMRNYQSLGVLLNKGVASAGTDTLTITLFESNAASGGTNQALATITDWYYKSTAAALAGNEAWTEVNQAAASTLALANSGPIKAANSALVYFDVETESMSQGFQWLNVTLSGLTSTNTIPGSITHIATGLDIMRRPDLLAQPNL